MRLKSSSVGKAWAGLASSAVLVLGIALPALAHVGLEPSEVPSESGVTLSFRIGHGCDGEPTDSVSILMPAGVASVSPFAKPGWNLEIERGTLPEPVTSGDEQITEGVTKVTWSGGSLAEGQTDVFEIRVSVFGDDGERVFFPVLQACGTAEHAWIEVPTDGSDGHDLDEPAPSLVIVAGHGEGASSGANPQTIVAMALSVTAVALSAAALAFARNGKADEGD